MKPKVTSFFDNATNTVSYVVQEPEGKSAAIIDSVLDFDYASGRTDTTSADDSGTTTTASNSGSRKKPRREERGADGGELVRISDGDSVSGSGSDDGIASN